jgi:2-oxoisovalerate dehydrogenase E1 component beta subunit
MRHFAVEAAEKVATEGIDAEVIDLRSIRPMDRAAILDSVRKTRRVLIVHEDQKFGGVGAEVSAIIAEEALFELDAPIRRVCGPDVPAMGYAKEYEEAFMPSPDRIAGAMRELAEF